MAVQHRRGSRPSSSPRCIRRRVGAAASLCVHHAARRPASGRVTPRVSRATHPKHGRCRSPSGITSRTRSSCRPTRRPDAARRTARREPAACWTAMARRHPWPAAPTVDAVGASPRGRPRAPVRSPAPVARSASESASGVIATMGARAAGWRVGAGRSRRLAAVRQREDQVPGPGGPDRRAAPPPGCRYSDGVPVEAKVAEIFCAMNPGFPIPVTTTRPGQASTISTGARTPRSSARRAGPRHRPRADHLARVIDDVLLRASSAGWSIVFGSPLRSPRVTTTSS